MEPDKIKIKRLLFLDIDGVMTSIEDGTSMWNCDPSSYSISSTATKNLFSILDPTDTKVVIHSSWVKWKDNPDYMYVYISPTGEKFAFESLLFNLISLLKEEGKYVDCTHHESRRTKRGDIEDWLANNKRLLSDDCKIAILDDDGWMELDKVKFDGHEIKFFECDTRTGLTGRIAEDVKNFLE